MSNEKYRLIGRMKNVEDHIRALEQELAGKSPETVTLISLIVFIRRGIDPDENWSKFRCLMASDYKTIIEELDTRWLVAICDTYADQGEDIEAIQALLISTFCNLIKLGDTFKLVCKNPDYDEAKLQIPPRELWDGVTSYLVCKGDMPRNLINRLNRRMGTNPVFRKLWNTVLARVSRSENFLTSLGKLNSVNPFFDESLGT